MCIVYIRWFDRSNLFRQHGENTKPIGNECNELPIDLSQRCIEACAFRKSDGERKKGVNEIIQQSTGASEPK